MVRFIHRRHTECAYYLHDFAGQTDDLHEVAITELAGDGAEDARAAGVILGVDQHDGVGVELDVGAVLAAGGAFGADHHGADDGFLFDFAASNDGLDAANDDIAQASGAALT